jgi:hypothetical protein
MAAAAARACVLAVVLKWIAADAWRVANPRS